MNPKTNSKTNAKHKPKRRALKILVTIIAVLILAGVIANKQWTKSGTNDWKLAVEQDGVVVHTLKTPGSFVLKMKATKRMKTNLGALVSVMQDVEAMCTHGCYDAKIISREGPHQLSTFTRFDFPFPLKDREWVLYNHFSQDAGTKEITYKIKAVPDLVEENKGYVRITHFNNKWRFTPVNSSEVEVEWYVDMDHGGYMVNLFHNMAIPDAMRNSLLEIEQMLQDDKYQSAKYDFVAEAVDEN
ncbi:MAG: hypothetical protein HC896_03270 [Bacteroidales bacterium]|nr:hypothetical protein [Bacteroidales bacterium]